MKKKENKKSLTPILPKEKGAGNLKKGVVRLKSKARSQRSVAEKRKDELERIKQLISNKFLDACKRLHHPIQSSGKPTSKRENSTVFLTIKPLIRGTFLFAEGQITESQNVKTWMMIRIYNN